jgi:uncharacterized RDD family membrane protein YckC
MPPVPNTDLVGPRCWNYVIDQLISLLAFVPALLVLPLAFVVDPFVVFVLFFFLYMVFTYAGSAWIEIGHPHRNDGQTYGMQVMDLKVVDAATLGPPTVGQLALRWLLLLFIDGGLVGLLLILLTDRHQRLGDMLAKTYVVREDDPVVAMARTGAPPAP